jgi:uncharacterized membrane protein YphA (DoxX/SURF4 family)
MRKEYATERDAKIAFTLLPSILVFILVGFISPTFAIIPAIITMIIAFFIVRKHKEWWMEKGED